MAEVDAKLATALKQAKSKPMFFAFVAKGAADGVLLVNRAKVPGKEIAEAKARLGGGTVFKGRCFGEDGRTVFETAKDPPATLAGQLRKIALRDAGVSLKIETRVGGDLEEEEAEEKDPSEVEKTPEAPPRPPLAAPDTAKLAGQFKDLLKAVSPVYQQAAKAMPERKAALDAFAAKATAAAKVGDFQQAQAHLATLAKAAKAVVAAASAAPKPAEPAAKPAETAAKPPAVTETGVSLVELQKCRLAWDAARKKVHAELTALQQAILDDIKDEPAAPLLVRMVKKFDKVKAKFDTALVDKLDEALNATDAKKRAKRNAEAGRMVKEFLAYLASEPLLKDIDANPFKPVTVQKSLGTTLTFLASKLGK